MKKLIFSIVLLSALMLNSFSQTNYSRGFQDGYKYGYCHNDYNCIPPVPPVTPPTQVGESVDSYKDGYNRGFKLGLEHKALATRTNRSTGTNSNIQSSQPAQSNYQSSYGQPAQSNYRNTYVSPDWDLLIRAAQAKQEYERQRTLAKMQQTVNRYLSFSSYPQTIKNGWHNAVVMDNYSICVDLKVYVVNNKITKCAMDNFGERGISFSNNIENGRGIIKIIYPSSESDYMDVFFIEAIANPYSSASEPLPSGKISFWTNLKRGGNLRIYLDEMYVGTLTSYFDNGTPVCGQNGTVTLEYKPGKYNYRAVSDGSLAAKTISGQVTIVAGGCTRCCITK